MLISMTGYGYGEAGTPGVRVQVELKSVNNRYCDVQLRLPREYMALEPRMVTQVREVYSRGRVEVHVRRTELMPKENRVKLNFGLIAQYHEQLASLQKQLNLTGPIELSTLVSFGGAITTVEEMPDPESEAEVVKEALGMALRSASAMRAREGEALKKDLEERLNTLKTLKASMAAHSSNLADAVQARLLARVRDALARAGAGELDNTRLLQEIVLQADKVDVSEELTRLESHLEQLAQLVQASDAVGRRIEFLIQELNREANTIGSKTPSTEVARDAMLMKVELEKIREQIQNVE